MYNKITLIGRLGSDPEKKVTQTGLSVTNISLATDRLQNKEKVTDWHKVTFFGKTADNVANYLVKGSIAMVEGELARGQYQNKEGQTIYTADIIAQKVVFLPSKQQTQVQPQYQQAIPQQQMPQQPPMQAPQNQQAMNQEIPF